MTVLKPEADAAEVGLDRARLERLDRHFARYVDDGRLPGWLITVSRYGRLAHVSRCGSRDIEAGLEVEPDTLWRIYSMTKPVTSVAAMMLYEEGALELTDPVSAFIPSFAHARVHTGGPDLRPVTVPATEPVRVWHLLTHTAGLTYGFHRVHPVDAMYRAAGFEWATPPALDLAQACDIWAGMPLLFDPGSEWNYSVATDILGRIVEVVSGQRFDEFLAARILRPLGMSDTSFWVGDGDVGRLAALYTPGADGTAVRMDALGNAARERPAMLSGGAGLVSTAADYHRFTQMLLRGGELDGERILGTRTLRYMTRNHLPGGRDLASLGAQGFPETTLVGIGFGLGFAVVENPLPVKTLMSPGEFYWGGMASTTFWVDPAEEVTGMLFTQLMPSGIHPLRPQLHQLVYSALVD